jgi:ATP-dependent helicase/nuclease subunit B
LGFSIFTIAAEQRFLRILARAVLDGFPLGETTVPLSRWTMLVPNRRSARALESILLEESGAKAMLLPRIKPIGDIDEELIADSLPLDGILNGISKTDHLHSILLLLTRWAERNPDAQLAQDVLQSGAQAFALASSLQQLVNQFETEDVNVEDLKGVYEFDLAGHRQNILDLLRVVTAKLPLLLEAQNLVGPAARRNMLIRLEAQRIANRKHRGPIIAAGSTGTNPATRDLLKAIAQDPMGAVVLPGLDLALDDAAWNAVTPEHPQFALRTLLEQWGIQRRDVEVLHEPQGSRMWLMGQALRPAAVADEWSTTLVGAEDNVREALRKVELVEATDRREEADVIALRLRKHIADSQGKAALITPDRDLALRVTAALKRWNLEIDDSAGEPLTHAGRAALLVLLLGAVEEEFSASSLFALLYQADCTLGRPSMEHLTRVRALELGGFRGLPETSGLVELGDRLNLRRKTVATDPHAHPLLRELTDAMWDDAVQLAAQLVAVVVPLADAAARPLAEHVDRLQLALDALSPPEDRTSPADQLLLDVLEGLRNGSQWHPILPLGKAQHSIIQALARETLRPPLNEDNRLAIYGLAEARLIDVQLAILGGLTEGAWPEHPDSGPWLNRPMRETLKLQQPERDIGVTAHDFAQGFGHPQVMVTWPNRLGGAPAIASRWVVRLKAVMQAAGVAPEHVLDGTLASIADQLDAPGAFTPQRRPQAIPPVASRPTRFSVTRIEKLVRDSYWVYARGILKLVPLDGIGEDVDAALRGSLIHAALNDWTKALPQVAQDESLKLLLAKGALAFRPYMTMPEVARFWWPRFERMAMKFIDQDRALRANTVNTLTEISGAIGFHINGVEHVLSARADRIDVEQTGGLRIIDYKSGAVPTISQMKSGFAPQLTLEAYMAMQGGFKTLQSREVRDVAYIAVGGTAKGVEMTSLAAKNDVGAEAAKAFAGLVALLEAFQIPATAYIPRHNPKLEDEVSDYDHLSRKLEWQLEGTAL